MPKKTPKIVDNPNLVLYVFNAIVYIASVF